VCRRSLSESAGELVRHGILPPDLVAGASGHAGRVRGAHPAGHPRRADVGFRRPRSARVRSSGSLRRANRSHVSSRPRGVPARERARARRRRQPVQHRGHRGDTPEWSRSRASSARSTRGARSRVAALRVRGALLGLRLRQLHAEPRVVDPRAAASSRASAACRTAATTARPARRWSRRSLAPMFARARCAC
jgi:hypothetical protein